MTFLADESIDRQIVERVRSSGYEVLSIAETSPGILDTQVLSRANEAGAVLLTADKDFGELVFRHRQPHAGVVYFRLSHTGLALRVARLEYVLRHHGDQLDQFLVVSDHDVRVRTG